jgi:hypothetical protein
MFTIIKIVNFMDPMTGIKVLTAKPLKNLMANGLIKNENLILRNCVGCRLAELLYPAQNFTNTVLQQ